MLIYMSGVKEGGVLQKCMLFENLRPLEHVLISSGIGIGSFFFFLHSRLIFL